MDVSAFKGDFDLDNKKPPRERGSSLCKAFNFEIFFSSDGRLYAFQRIGCLLRIRISNGLSK